MGSVTRFYHRKLFDAPHRLSLGHQRGYVVLQSGKRIVNNCPSYASHQAQVKMQVVNRVQPVRQYLVYHVEMSQVSAGEVLAGITMAIGI